ncbi:MAG: alkaline phosphatase family protein, partial [Candidatus Bipolaricaulia bacterium]
MNFNYKIVGLLLLSLLLVLGAGLAESTVTPDRLIDEGAQTGTGLAPAPPLNVILISWDGTQRAHLAELRGQGLLPNLEALAEEGATIPMEVIGHATDTKAGHSQMLTGYGPDITGVYSNRRYRAIPEGLTIFERLKARFGRSITTIAITGKRGNISEILENALPELDFALIRNADAALNGPRMLQALEALQDRPFLAFFHFSDPDHAGHAHGENSQEYSEAIQICDRWLGEIVARLKELGIYEKTLLYVTTDHGFDEGQRSHLNAPEIWLVTNDPQVDRREDLTANQGDVAPTILERFGFDLGSIEPPLPGRSLISGSVSAASVTIEREIVFATVESLPLKLDAYRPELPGPLPAIIFVHGGGWVGGDKRGMEPYARYFAERGYVGFAINYRLAPGFKFPAQIEDVKCAVRWVRQHAAEYNVDPDRIGALGTSAGGHLVGLLGVTDGSEGLEGACGDPAISSRVQAVVPYFGPMDLVELFSGTAHGAQTAMKLLGTTCEASPETCRRASPIAHVSPDDPP